MTSEQSPNLDTVLVAIDGSHPSQTSAKAAIQLAKRQNLQVSGLYVVGSEMVMEDGVAIKSELNEETESIMTSNLVDQFKSQGDEALNWLEQQCLLSGVQVTSEILFGGITEMIIERSKHAKLLALGRRGYVHDSESSSLGKNFRTIISHQYVPILIGGEMMTNFRRLWIILTDWDESKKLIDWGESLQKLFSSDVLISIYKGNETLSSKAQSAFEQFKRSNLIGYTLVIGPITSRTEIAEAAKDYKVDLIIMEGYRRNILGLRPEKHPLNDVLHNSEVMVLAV
jgi:nucleotide-binding universal stress UspA family protein